MSGNARNFFDPNILIPQLNTLAHSEPLQPELVLTCQVMLCSKNAIPAFCPFMIYHVATSTHPNGS
ncbi:MAG: hypothetical protein P8Y44_03315 [Acidobacteriota bacterium]